VTLFIERKLNMSIDRIQILKLMTFDQLHEHATKGDALAQFVIGDRLLKGTNVTKNEGEAVRWFKLAAEKELAEAQSHLGYCYQNGLGVLESPQEAIMWHRLAALQNFPCAQFNLGLCYDMGYGVPQDKTEAVKWYHLAAVQGDVHAQQNLGYCYATGEGVALNKSESLKWYKEAADGGLASAQCAAAERLEGKNNLEALRLLRESANQGFGPALTALGYLYATGSGVERDFVRAAKLISLGKQQGDAARASNASSTLRRAVTKHKSDLLSAITEILENTEPSYPIHELTSTNASLTV